MAIKELGVTQKKLEGVRVVDFFDNEFVGMLEKQFSDAKFRHFSLIIFDDEKEKIEESLAIIHENIEDEKKDIVTIDAMKPESLIKLQKIIEEFDRKKC